MEEQRICSHCGCILEESEGIEMDDDLICDDCAEQHTVTCDHCGETVWTEDSVTDDRTTLCTACFDDHYRRCEDCGRILHDSDVLRHNDYAYCEHCYDRIDTEIEEYGYKPEPVFYGEGNRFFGVELEIDCGGKDQDAARQIKDMANTRCERIYCKSDGSLNDGFEIVTHPMTLDYHLQEMPWADVLHETIRLHYKSHMTSTCGLHIHVNRSSFGDTRNELFIFSRRSPHSMDRWAARYGMEKTGKQILDKAKKGNTGRYAAITLCPYQTIEFRLFRGTLRLNTLIATLQLVNRICDTTMTKSEDEIGKQSWRDFVIGIEEPELIQYLKERQLYVNEEIESEEEQ